MNRRTMGMSCRAVAWAIAALLPAGSSLATPTGVVASFNLVDQHGQPVTGKDFQGSFMLFLPPSFDDEREYERDDSDNSRYLMQHSASTYLVGPDGRLESIFPHEISPREMARQLEGFVVEDS